MRRSGISLAVMLFSVVELRADHRMAFLPSLEVAQVSDDNLNYSPVEPVRDRVRRVTPTLALRFDSRRWSARVSCGLDSEQYANHPDLDARRARQRAGITLHYLVSPRLTLAMAGDYLDTNALADLNSDTALAAARERGKRIGAGASAHFQVSPTTTLIASASSAGTNVVKGSAMRSQGQSFGVERRLTSRDIFGLEWEHNHVDFTGAAGPVLDTHSILAGWTRHLGAHDRVVFRAGPRFNDRSPSLDISASVEHQWKRSAFGLSLLRNQTTVIGHVGAVQTESARANFSYAWNRQWNAYLAPAVFRTTQNPFQGIVYRISAGTRYAVTSFLSADALYSHDSQHGAIDPAWPTATFSHSTLSFGLTTRWNNPDGTR